MRKQPMWLSALSASLAVAGCFGSGEPGANDILEALRRNEQFRAAVIASAPVTIRRESGDTKVMGFEEMRKQQETAGAEMLKRMTVEQTACAVAQGAPGFVCDFRLGLPDANGALQPRPAKGRFFKANDGWQYSPA
jgi:hypothetical protein